MSFYQGQILIETETDSYTWMNLYKQQCIPPTLPYQVAKKLFDYIYFLLVPLKIWSHLQIELEISWFPLNTITEALHDKWIEQTAGASISIVLGTNQNMTVTDRLIVDMTPVVRGHARPSRGVQPLLLAVPLTPCIVKQPSNSLDSMTIRGASSIKC